MLIIKELPPITKKREENAFDHDDFDDGNDSFDDDDNDDNDNDTDNHKENKEANFALDDTGGEILRMMKSFLSSRWEATPMTCIGWFLMSPPLAISREPRLGIC